MSNTEASKLFEAVIDEVINESRQDFENSGIDEGTLQELKRIWCEKLTQSQVAKFPWDQSISQHQQHQQSLQQVGSQSLSLQPVGSQPQYSSQAAENYQQEIKLEHPDLLSYNTGSVSVDNGINDNGDLGGIQLPNIPNFKEEYDDNDGLMLPTVTQTDGSNFELTIETENPEKFIKSLKKLKGVDGVSDDEVDDNLFNDSDDINSELDDDLESGKSDDEDNEQDGHIMLCLYDKVQRIKNKWKCNLKEGVANINGKDYVFQKATGESEW